MKPQLEFGAQIGVARKLDTEGAPRSSRPSSRCSAMRDLAGRRLALQSADGDARLCGALRSARRRVHQWRRALAASRGRQLARRYRRGPLDADKVVVALGPWSPDVLEPLGIKLPLGIKRGYHRHFRRRAMPR